MEKLPIEDSPMPKYAEAIKALRAIEAHVIGPGLDQIRSCRQLIQDAVIELEQQERANQLPVPFPPQVAYRSPTGEITA